MVTPTTSDQASSFKNIESSRQQIMTDLERTTVCSKCGELTPLIKLAPAQVTQQQRYVVATTPTPDQLSHFRSVAVDVLYETIQSLTNKSSTTEEQRRKLKRIQNDIQVNIKANSDLAKWNAVMALFRLFDTIQVTNVLISNARKLQSNKAQQSVQVKL